MKLPPLPFTVLDTETTGFVPRVHHVIEFASMQATDGKITDTYEQLFSVKEEIPPHIQILTRIFPEDIKNAPTFAEKLEEVKKHIGEDTLLVGQNLGFDIGMIRGEGIDLSARPWIDTSMLASLVFPEFRSYSLGYMSATLSLDHSPAHRALGDVRATTELLSKIWERLLELSADELAFAKDVLGKTNSGYVMLFDALPASHSNGASWIAAKKKKEATASKAALALAKPALGTVQLYEEGLDPDGLQSIINAAATSNEKTWLAVKNLEAHLRRLELPENVTVIHPAHLLLNPDAAIALRNQSQLTSDEALLTMKLEWFTPRTRNDLALHGLEKDIWSGKLSCTEKMDAYTSQFTTDARVYILDHRQLLAFLADPSHAAHGALTLDAHIIIDDASMLEDTATKAYGHECSVDNLRAASTGDEALTSLTDLLSLWIEKMRRGEDVHYLTRADLETPEAKGLRSQVGDILATGELPERTTEQLIELAALLEQSVLTGNIVWAEARINGSLYLHAAPESVDKLLDESLYSRFATTLLVPTGCTEKIAEIVPASRTIKSVIDERRKACDVTVSFPEDTLANFLSNPPEGKSIVLAGSKRIIEQMYIDHTQNLEKKGVTLICQGLSGGQGRMESEFLASTGTTVWIITPWMYEGTELPRNSADRLVLDALPFDHPGHPIFGKRKNHHRNGFEDYAMPRVECRLFRLLRTFCRERTEGGEMIVLDKRLREKAYGRRITQYLGRFGTAVKTSATKEDQMRLF